MFFCGMVDQRNAFSHISSWEHCQRSSPLRISDIPQAEFEPVENLSSGFLEWSCAVVITTTPQRCYCSALILFIPWTTVNSWLSQSLSPYQSTSWTFFSSFSLLLHNLLLNLIYSCFNHSKYFYSFIIYF